MLIDSSDIDWHHTAMRVIEFLSSIWGGRHSVIVPTDGSVIGPVFWGVLEKFSPDYVYFYQKTGADIKISHPDKFAALFQQQIERYDSTFDGEKERIDKDLQNALIDSFNLSGDLCSQIVDRLVPFHFERHFNPIFGNGYVPNELTRIPDVLPYVDHPQSFVTFEVPPEINPLWWMARTGMYPKTFSEQLGDLNLKEESIPVPVQDLGSFVDWIVGGDFGTSSRKIDELLGRERGFKPPDQGHLTPFDISMSCVGLYGHPRVFRAFNDHFALVLGDSIQDFCLSYCLPRIGHRSAWLPLRWVAALQPTKDSPLRSCAYSVIFAAPVDVRLHAGVKACSFSTGTDSGLETFEILKKYTSYGLNNEKLCAVEPINVLESAPDALTLTASIRQTILTYTRFSGANPPAQFAARDLPDFPN